MLKSKLFPGNFQNNFLTVVLQQNFLSTYHETKLLLAAHQIRDSTVHSQQTISSDLHFEMPLSSNSWTEQML
jgi:hypothetical protein